MISSFRCAYGAGYRAGYQGASSSLNPFRKWYEAFHGYLWNEGHYKGNMTSLQRWLQTRKPLEKEHNYVA